MTEMGNSSAAPTSAPRLRSGTLFKTATPYYAVERLVERLLESGRGRGTHAPKKLATARVAFKSRSSGENLGRWLTLEPELLLAPCDCVDPITAQLFEQLGYHRETLLVANTPAARQAARRWLQTVLFGGYGLVPRAIDRDLMFDTCYAQDPTAWAELLRQRPGLLRAAVQRRKCESLPCARQACAWAFIAMHMWQMRTPPKAGLRRESKAQLTEAFLKVPNGWVLGVLEPEDLRTVYDLCLDWIARLDIAPEKVGADAGHHTVASSEALPQSDVDYVRSKLAGEVWQAICRESPRNGALRLAAHALGCSVEKLRRGMRTGKRDASETAGLLLRPIDYAHDIYPPVFTSSSSQTDTPTWPDLEQRFRTIPNPFMRADYTRTGSGEISGRIAQWATARVRAEFEDAACAAARLLRDSSIQADADTDESARHVEDFVSQWLVAIAEAVGGVRWFRVADENDAAVVALGTLNRVVEASWRFCAQRRGS